MYYLVLPRAAAPLTDNITEGFEFAMHEDINSNKRSLISFPYSSAVPFWGVFSYTGVIGNHGDICLSTGNNTNYRSLFKDILQFLLLSVMSILFCTYTATKRTTKRTENKKPSRQINMTSRCRSENFMTTHVVVVIRALKKVSFHLSKEEEEEWCIHITTRYTHQQDIKTFSSAKSI